MKAGPIDPWRSTLELKRALDDRPSLLFDVARDGSADDLLRCIGSLEHGDDRRKQLVLSALASRPVTDEELARLAAALEQIERSHVLGRCESIPRARLEAAGFAEEMGWWGRPFSPPENQAAPEPSEAGRAGEERRLFHRRFPLGNTVAEAHFGYVAERSAHELGPSAPPLPPLLAAFVEQHRLGPKIDAVRRGEIAVRPEGREEMERLLATLDDGARFQLRELLLPRKPLHALRAEHAKDEAFRGKATVAKLMRILSGEMFGERAEVDRERADEVLKLVAKHLTPGSELEWAEVLSRTAGAAQLVEAFGAGALPLIAAFGAESMWSWGSGLTLFPLANAAVLRPEVADEAKAYFDRHGPKQLVAALETLDGSGRAELPEKKDGWTWIALNESEIAIPSATALRWLSFEDAVGLLDFVSKDQTGVRAALYLMDPALAAPSSDLTMGEDDRARTLVRIVRERGLGALEEMVEHAKERIHDFGDDSTPLWTGAAWPPKLERSTSSANLAEISSRTRRMIDELAEIPGAKETLERELAGRRFVAFTYYDPLYDAGVENPEHRYSKTTFDAWKQAEAEMRRRADEGKGRPLEAGWLTALFSELHAIAGRGMIDAGQTGNMSGAQLGHLRRTDKEQVQLPELVEIDRETAARLKANKFLGKGTHLVQDGSTLKARICFADGDRVPRLLEVVDRFVRRNEGKMPIEELAAQVHNALVGIHAPFDGNGRTSKLVIDFLMRRAGIEPMIWRQRHPLKDPTTRETVRTGVQFTHDTVLRHHRHAFGARP